MSDSKTKVYFSPNTDHDDREAFSDILGFRQTECLWKYLGFPIKHQGSSYQDFGFVLDRVKCKLAGWKANLLSMAGRAVLIQASSSAIPTYLMQCNLLLGKVLEGTDRVNKNFMWGSTEDKGKMHWVGWKKVTRSKEEGGLGVQSAKGRNTVLLAKLNWRFHSEDKAPWAKVLRLKYCNPQRINSRNARKLPSSRIWKGLLQGEETFKKAAKWLPGFDSNLDFWNDTWTNYGPLRKIIQGPLAREATNLKIKDVVDFSGRWDWSSIQMIFTEEVYRDIKAIPVLLFVRLEDRLSWKYLAKGDFELKSAYRLVTDPLRDVPFNGKWIWKLKTLPKIQMFV